MILFFPTLFYLTPDVLKDFLKGEFSEGWAKKKGCEEKLSRSWRKPEGFIFFFKETIAGVLIR